MRRTGILSRSGYRLFPHTADIGLSAWADNLADAFGKAVRGLTAVTFDVRRVRPRETREVRTTGDDLAQLLVGLLTEALFLKETEGFLAAGAEVKIQPGRLSACLHGECFDPARHARIGPEVKAITYHQISVHCGPPAQVRVILDI